MLALTLAARNLLALVKVQKLLISVKTTDSGRPGASSMFSTLACLSLRFAHTLSMARHRADASTGEVIGAV
jgi:hypothetical protein